ncbi:hypothetical protein AB0451_07815 [Streptomyces sp. NPDC052000]|uniref:hypothetical protein n=1 Tax=Streptomyces sp. NPDC052000 TaxID=3155676 RepID=UPI00345046C0
MDHLSPPPTSNGPTTATCSLTPDITTTTCAIDHILVRELSWVVSALSRSLALRRRRAPRHLTGAACRDLTAGHPAALPA